MATPGKRLTATCMLVLFTVQSGCFEMFSCENEVISEIIAPDGERKAIVFSRNCGAPTATSYHVSVLSVNEGLGDQPGNVIIAELKGSPSVSLSIAWPSDTLLIHYDAPGEVFKQVSEIAGHPVVYTAGDGVDIEEQANE